MNKKCPKCKAKLNPLYMKENCPNCGVNLLYYKMEERLEEDAQKAKREVDAVNRFFNMIKESAIASKWHIIRLILFFTPLASMCLPMFWAGHKNVSIITFIMSIVNHGFDLGAIAADKSYLFAVLSIILVIVLSLAVIISSLFSAAEKGYERNMCFSALNAIALLICSIAVAANGGRGKIGLLVTFVIYCAEFVLHYVVSNEKTKKKTIHKITTTLLCLICIAAGGICMISKTSEHYSIREGANAQISVVSFNTAAPWGNAFDDTKSEDRASRFAEYIAAVKPDLAGTQELNSKWLELFDEFKKENPDSIMHLYEHYAVKRGGDADENTSEMNGIFWNKDKFTAIQTNTFWLTETPDVESRYTYIDENKEKQEAGCNRICSYAILKDNDENLIAFMNTHLDNASEQAMHFGAKLIVKKIGEIKAQYGDDIKVILTGDFNQTSDGEAYKIITSALNDTTDASKQKATWQDWGYSNTGNKPIDFIFTSGSPRNYDVLDEIPYGYVSDHYGILAEIDF